MSSETGVETDVEFSCDNVRAAVGFPVISSCATVASFNLWRLLAREIGLSVLRMISGSARGTTIPYASTSRP